MYIEIWTIPIFACLFGYCALWNRKHGKIDGIELTVNYLCDRGIIKLPGDQVLERMGFQVKIKD